MINTAAQMIISPEINDRPLFMSGKGSGAKLFFFFLWIAGIFVCLAFRKSRHILKLEQDK